MNYKGYRYTSLWKKIPIAFAIRGGKPNEIFYREIRKLLLGPAADLLAILHAVTWSGVTLNGLIRNHNSRDGTDSERYAVIQFLRDLFRVPLYYHKNHRGLLPIDVAKEADSREVYYVLRKAIGWKGNGDKEVYFRTAFGTLLALGAETGALVSLEDKQMLYDMADKWGMDLAQFLGTAFTGQVLLPLAGVGCYFFFQSRKGKETIRGVESHSPLMRRIIR